MTEVNENLNDLESKNSTDYLGFTFNGRHSSSLGIVRISDGSRFNENLLPTIQDKTLQVPGGDGTYFFGSYYTQKQFNIQFAFDMLTEQQFAELKAWLGDKQIHELWFDELPYKEYQAKVTGSATIKHIPFDDSEKQRIYKGEGSIQFTAYYPYAKSRFKFLNESGARNVDEWKEASGMQNDRSNGPFDSLTNQKMKVYNPGDIETDFQFRLQFDETGIIPNFTISFLPEVSSNRIMTFNSIKRQKEDVYLQIDTKLNLIEGLNADGKKTGSIYNKYMIAGQFFKIPKANEPIWLQISLEGAAKFNPQIFYDFYYF